MWQILSRQYASQLQLEIKPSRIYQTIVLILSTMVCLSIVVVDINSLILKLVVTILFIASVIYALANNRARRLLWQADGVWLVKQEQQFLDGLLHNQQNLKAYLRSGSVVTTFFSVLNFKCHNGRFHNVVLFKDSLSAEDFRKLRVRLKLEGIGSESRDIL